MVVNVRKYKRRDGTRVVSHKRSNPSVDDLAFKAGDRMPDKKAPVKKKGSLKDMVKSKKNFPAEFKRTVSFVDKEGKNVKAEIEYKLLSGNRTPYFAIKRDRAGSSGAGGWVPKNKPQQELLTLQDKYHLKEKIPFSMEQDVDDIIARIKNAEGDEQDDLGLDGWKLTALKELSKEAYETFTDAKDESYDNRFQDREGLYLEGAGEYIVFEDYETAENAARDYVKEQLDDEPELFTQDWLQQFSYISDTDRRIISQEESDNYVDNLEPADVETEGNVGDRIEEIDDELSELEEKENASDSRINELYAEKDRVMDEAREEIRSKRYDEIYDSLSDPYNYFVEEQGIYSAEDYYKQSFVSINTDAAAESAINTDGVAHFFASYDGEEIELPSGAYAYRVN